MQNCSVAVADCVTIAYITEANLHRLYLKKKITTLKPQCLLSVQVSRGLQSGRLGLRKRLLCRGDGQQRLWAEMLLFPEHKATEIGHLCAWVILSAEVNIPVS